MKKKNKSDMLHEVFEGRMVGGSLSELANYSDLFNKMNESVFLLDRTTHRILECNPSSIKMLRQDESEILGNPIEVFFPGVNLTGTMTQSLDFDDPSGSKRHFEVMTTELQILDYIHVLQFLVKDVTDVKRSQLELESANQILKKLSTTDAMTGLWNLRYFKEVMDSAHAQAVTNHTGYGIIFIDVDHFKKYNDRNGHPAGDEVLRGVAKILQGVVNDRQTAARYGGEEFVVLSRESNLEHVIQTAEHIREAIVNDAFPHRESQPLGFVSASIGVAVYPDHGATPDVVLKAADTALYASKEAGRNRVTAYSAMTAAKKKAA